MANFINLIEANTQAADIAANPHTPLNDTLGDLVLRNTVVALDRLDAAEFEGLSQGTKDLVYDTTRIANDLAPVAPEDLLPLPHESPAEYAYRLHVRQPIGKLQANLNSGAYKYETPEEISRVKKALHVGAAAFAAVVYESIDRPAILETENYFWGNTTAALSRAERLTQ